jgi:hypothetical protein
MQLDGPLGSCAEWRDADRPACFFLRYKRRVARRPDRVGVNSRRAVQAYLVQNREAIRREM